MLGKRTQQAELFDVGNVYALRLKPGSFHGQLAQAAPHLFRDEDFAAIYDQTNGRPSVAPSQLSLVLVMQQEAGVSDEEAIARTAFDLRWCAVLRKAGAVPLCAKSTLQLFRAHLLLHEQVATIFRRSIQEARRAGLLKGGALRVALDTKPMDGRGAVLDTYNLLAEGIRQLVRALARRAGMKAQAWMRTRGLGRYAQASLKGSVDIDWSDEGARNGVLGELVADARRLLAEASGQGEEVRQAAGLLVSLLLQDVQVQEPTAAQQAATEATTEQAATEAAGVLQASIKAGTVPGRIPSVSDPQQRHGRKSKSKVFTGHKAAIAVDQDSQIITAVAVLAGDAPDATDALTLVEQSEENTGLAAESTTGDCAYGGGPTRQAFEEAGRVLYAKVPQESDAGGLFPKRAFVIDLGEPTVTCPEGRVCRTYVREHDGGQRFVFGSLCQGCPLRAWCTRSPAGRTLSVHPQEALLQEARAYQQTPEGRQTLRARVVVEHRLARMGQLGIGQARYAGRAKSGFQLMMAATVANLRRTWNWAAGQCGTDGLQDNQPPDSRAGARLSARLGRCAHDLARLFTFSRSRFPVCWAA